MEDTKEKILETAIELFAEKGYSDVSMRELASGVGIKASSIYKHFSSKNEILEEIFSIFTSVMEQSAVEEGLFLQNMEAFDLETFLRTGYEIFKRFAFSSRINQVVSIIIKERTRNERVKDFFIHQFIDSPIHQLENQFSELIKMGVIQQANANFLAKMYHGYIINLYFVNNFLPGEPDIERIDREMYSFIGEFSEMIKK